MRPGATRSRSPTRWIGRSRRSCSRTVMVEAAVIGLSASTTVEKLLLDCDSLFAGVGADAGGGATAGTGGVATAGSVGVATTGAGGGTTVGAGCGAAVDGVAGETGAGCRGSDGCGAAEAGVTAGASVGDGEVWASALSAIRSETASVNADVGIRSPRRILVEDMALPRKKLSASECRTTRREPWGEHERPRHPGGCRELLGIDGRLMSLGCKPADRPALRAQTWGSDSCTRSEQGYLRRGL